VLIVGSSLLSEASISDLLSDMRKSILTLGLFAALAFATPARADVPPPNSAGCMGKVAGDACQKDDMSAGTCESQTCTKLDYSMGTPPVSVDYTCVLCSGPAGGSSSSSSSGGGESDEEGGCSVRGGGMAGAAGAWILGAAVLMLARRNRGKKSSS